LKWDGYFETMMLIAIRKAFNRLVVIHKDMVFYIDISGRSME